MRLTLRTLLAYRDRVLNAGELDDMHRRVQQSAMASNLLKRLDSLSQRTNILAPPIEGNGLGADANSIAEYLDDTLKGEKVPELERICLESDVQLAELAHCHRMLSAALSTPVEVPASLRQRVIALGNDADRAEALARRNHRPVGASEMGGTENHAPQADALTGHVADRATGTAAGQVAGSNGSRLRPDKAHESTNPQPQDGQPAKKPERVLVPAQAVTAPMVASGGDSIRPSGLDLEGSHLAHEVPEYLRGRSRDGWLAPLAIGGLVCLLCLLVWQSVGSWSSVRDMFTLSTSETPTPESTPASDNDNGRQPVAVVDQPAPDAPSTDSNQPVPPKPAADAVVPANSGSLPFEGAASEVSPPKNDSAAVAEPNTAVAAPQLAQWLPADASSMQAVALVQAQGGVLHRLMPSEGLTAGSQIFVPAANRPRINLTQGPQWQVCGITHAMLIKPDTGSQADTMLDLRLGRAVLQGDASSQAIALTSPAGTLRLQLGNGASAAVEVSYVPRAHGPVTNPSVYVPTMLVMSLEGEPTLTVNNQELKLAAGHKIVLQPGRVSQPEAGDIPVWTDSSFERPVDLLAAADLAKQLTDNATVGEVLQRLATNRRPETRALASQTLSLLGSWEWVALPKSSLSETRDRSYWAVLLDRTRQILAAHPDNFHALEATLAQLDPQTAQWRLALWLGLDAKQLQADSGKAIVNSLESNALIERILAIQQLQRATGKDLGYQAGEPNRTIVQQWARDLGSGKVQWLPAPKS